MSHDVTEHEELGQIRTWTDTEGDRWSFYRMIQGKALQAGEKCCWQRQRADSSILCWIG